MARIAKENKLSQLGDEVLASLGIPTGDKNIDEFRALDESPTELIFGEPSLTELQQLQILLVTCLEICKQH